MLLLIEQPVSIVSASAVVEGLHHARSKSAEQTRAPTATIGRWYPAVRHQFSSAARCNSSSEFECKLNCFWRMPLRRVK